MKRWQLMETPEQWALRVARWVESRTKYGCDCGCNGDLWAWLDTEIPDRLPLFREAGAVVLMAPEALLDQFHPGPEQPPYGCLKHCRCDPDPRFCPQCGGWYERVFVGGPAYSCGCDLEDVDNMTEMEAWKTEDPYAWDE